MPQLQNVRSTWSDPRRLSPSRSPSLYPRMLRRKLAKPPGCTRQQGLKRHVLEESAWKQILCFLANLQEDDCSDSAATVAIAGINQYLDYAVNVPGYHKIIDTMALTGHDKEALRWYDTCQMYYYPITIPSEIHEAAIHAHSQLVDPEGAQLIFDKLSEPNPSSYGHLIKAYARAGQLPIAMNLLHRIVHQQKEKGLPFPIRSGNIILLELAPAGRWEEALELLSFLEDNASADLVSYSAVVSSCCTAGQIKAGLEVWEKRKEACKAKPTCKQRTMVEGTYHLLIEACFENGQELCGRRLVSEMEDEGITVDVSFIDQLRRKARELPAVSRRLDAYETLSESQSEDNGGPAEAIILPLVDREHTNRGPAEAIILPLFD